MGNVSGDIVRNVGRANRIRSGRGNKENADIIVVKNSDQNANELRRRECTNLHTDSIQNQAEEIVNTLTTANELRRRECINLQTNSIQNQSIEKITP